jgi:hypothetical protein
VLAADSPVYRDLVGTLAGVAQRRDNVSEAWAWLGTYDLEELGDLDRVTRWLRAVGYVQTAPDFPENAKVVNGLSDLIVEIWGDAGRHARSSPGRGPSPLNVSIIVDAIVAVSD